MEMGNRSEPTEFILLGLSSDSSVQTLLFCLFLTLCVSSLVANGLLIVAVKRDGHLHSSMYFFLANLSIMDICYTSVIVPKALVNFLGGKKSISYNGCVLQIFFYLFMGESECILLAFMAYDRYVAICSPLSYSTILSTAVCARMISASWVAGCLISALDVGFIYRLTFCGTNTIDHFFCEVPSLIQLTCTNVTINVILMFAGGAILLLLPLLLILFSYIQIFIAAKRISCGRYKAFSTCAAHLIVVVLFYGTATFMYMRPRHSAQQTDKIVSVFYTVVTPMLNPLIYRLRNREVHGALRGLRRSSASPCHR
ncbi:hypothetical protein XENTR_v10015254 [Xenopus tropicalis]|uniref:Olfactory receptor n=1 Tax=Xenopus tropicalis TaxID=8364 RepID=A0A8J0QRB9_XENTR|nr:olfactory receptor 2D2-like [Xenopus tropicalis]KAE8605640.1 hypothetical protein XENTR_v10015254 [Xenopus tropicalis]|eukprot:XP_002938216.2 PREDICTED: olfactory receptor 2D2-like [Xenopus tropicalis]